MSGIHLSEMLSVKKLRTQIHRHVQLHQVQNCQEKIPWQKILARIPMQVYIRSQVEQSQSRSVRMLVALNPASTMKLNGWLLKLQE